MGWWTLPVAVDKALGRWWGQDGQEEEEEEFMWIVLMREAGVGAVCVSVHGVCHYRMYSDTCRMDQPWQQGERRCCARVS